MLHTRLFLLGAKHEVGLFLHFGYFLLLIWFLLVNCTYDWLSVQLFEGFSNRIIVLLHLHL